MAPAVNKRRRGEEEVRRPKKKVKKVKKQAFYDSSDDEDAPETAAFDAPKPVKMVEAKETEKAVDVPQRPKPILKHTLDAPKPQPASEELEKDEDEHSDGGVEIDELEKNTALNTAPDGDSDVEADDPMEPAQNGEALPSSDEDDDEDDDDEFDTDDDDDADTRSQGSMTSSNAIRLRKKRNDPDAFATSITKILASKLTTSKRSDPVLSRSKSAADANKTLADQKLEGKARAQMRAEKKASLEKGRVKDVLALGDEGVATGEVMGEERRLKKLAQRGVVKLFNAVRAAQVKGEEAGRAARAEGVVGMGKREERVSEMSKQGFLDLISAGGK